MEPTTPRAVLIAVPALLVTIDSATTRDIDDAISVEQIDDRYRVVVCITDVTKLVAPGSTEDENARLLGATVYTRDTAVRSMLPRHISEARGSLVAGKPRRCFVFEVVLDAELEVERFTITRQTVTVSHRLSYDDVPTILQNEADPLYALISASATLSHKLLAKRRKRGAMALYDLARLLYMDEDGRLQQLARKDLVVGHIVVQELMILTNTLAAGHMVVHEIPGLFRNHAAKPAAPDSGDLATTVETWLRSGTMDTAEVQTTFATLMGKAAYGASVTGHYALALPFYGHFTSPLRRYADLANQFQLLAHLKGRPPLRTKEDLAILAEHLNEKAEDRKEERAEGFKETVKRHASQALDRGDLSRLADHEMVQAIKLSMESLKISLEGAAEIPDEGHGTLPDVLVDELVARLDGSTITDKVTVCLLATVGSGQWPQTLKIAFQRWLELFPARAVQLLHQAEQTAFIRHLDMSSEGEGTSFEGIVRITDGGGSVHIFRGRGSRKKDAEQWASAKAVLWLIGVDVVEALDEPSDPPQSPKMDRPTGNPKGALLELCTKNGWAQPTFTSSGQGPSHAMVFSATVAVDDGRTQHRFTSTGAATKKDAEAIASAMLMDALKATLPVAPVAPMPSSPIAPAGEITVAAAPAVAGNAVGQLQEAAQKGKWPLPEYTIETLSEVPPRFKATVTVHGPKGGRFSGEATTKQEAKKRSAESAIRDGSR